MSSTRMRYRMGTPNPQNGYIRPVNKVVTRTDGKMEYVQLEKEVAPSLAAFREMWPTEPVEGAPRGDELRVIANELTDADLAKLGLARTAPDPRQAVTFASEEAELRALEAGISLDELTPGGGNGAGGAYTSGDIRYLAAKKGESITAEV
jgi:hypothetical protein